MHLNVSDYLQKKISSATIEVDPYPHILIENIFPKEYYKFLLEFEIGTEYLQGLDEVGRVSNYPPGRKFIELKENMPILPQGPREFWQETATFINEKMTALMLEKFSPYVAQTLGRNTSTDITSETLYVRDHRGYALSPHTDSPEKILTFLIYLAKDSKHKNLGTSVYRPKDPNFSCNGGPLHPFENFELLKTAPYQPNTLFGFVKGDQSFHGVEPVQDNYERNLIIYDIRKVVNQTSNAGPQLRLRR